MLNENLEQQKKTKAVIYESIRKSVEYIAINTTYSKINVNPSTKN